MTPEQMRAQLNPAGSDGRNARVEGGQSVAYMAVFTNVPADYDPTRYSVTVEISQAQEID
jgi:hypothetical protein